MIDLIFDTAATQIVSTVVGGLCAYLWTMIQKKKNEIAEKDKIIDKLVENDQAQLRLDIINTYYVWAKEGYMPVMVKESLYKCYERYHACNGNSFVEDVILKVKEMPTEAENNG